MYFAPNFDEKMRCFMPDIPSQLQQPRSFMKPNKVYLLCRTLKMSDAESHGPNTALTSAT